MKLNVVNSSECYKMGQFSENVFVATHFSIVNNKYKPCVQIERRIRVRKKTVPDELVQ